MSLAQAFSRGAEPPRAFRRLPAIREPAIDWSRLAFVLLRGPAMLLTDPTAHARAVVLLRARYAQYRAMALDDPERNPAVRLEPAHVTFWRAAR